MNKQKTHKKVFVRNTEQALPQSKISETSVKCDRKRDKTPTDTKKTATNYLSSKFDDPQSHSTEKISKKIKELDKLNSRKVKSVSDIDKTQHLILGEKITKQVNFPYEQPIYKHLIPLCVKMQSQPMIVSRDPLPLKDKEPVLSDFFTAKPIPEYTFHISSQLINKGQKCQYKGLKLYSTIQNWQK